MMLAARIIGWTLVYFAIAIPICMLLGKMLSGSTREDP